MTKHEVKKFGKYGLHVTLKKSEGYSEGDNVKVTPEELPELPKEKEVPTTQEKETFIEKEIIGITENTLIIKRENPKPTEDPFWEYKLRGEISEATKSLLKSRQSNLQRDDGVIAIGKFKEIKYNGKELLTLKEVGL